MTPSLTARARELARETAGWGANPRPRDSIGETMVRAVEHALLTFGAKCLEEGALRWLDQPGMRKLAAELRKAAEPEGKE